MRTPSAVMAPDPETANAAGWRRTGMTDTAPEPATASAPGWVRTADGENTPRAANTVVVLASRLAAVASEPEPVMARDVVARSRPLLEKLPADDKASAPG